MKSENIRRFKDLAFLGAFLILVLSFSNRSFGKAATQAEKQTRSYSSEKSVAVNTPQQGNLNHSPERLLLPLFKFENTEAKILSVHLKTKISEVLKTKRLVNLPGISRLYYLLFIHQADEDAA